MLGILIFVTDVTFVCLRVFTRESETINIVNQMRIRKNIRHKDYRIILNIGGARLIFMNSSKCPTKSLIKKGDVVLSGSFA